jgi:predicted PurR-regulated permease PerM
VIVAVTDALGVMIAAAILRVPFVLAIGVLVFLGAFVPIVGAFVAGTVAVLVALVDHGPVVALIMLGA